MGVYLLNLSPNTTTFTVIDPATGNSQTYTLAQYQYVDISSLVSWQSGSGEVEVEAPGGYTAGIGFYPTSVETVVFDGNVFYVEYSSPQQILQQISTSSSSSTSQGVSSQNNSSSSSSPNSSPSSEIYLLNLSPNTVTITVIDVTTGNSRTYTLAPNQYVDISSVISSLSDNVEVKVSGVGSYNIGGLLFQSPIQTIYFWEHEVGDTPSSPQQVLQSVSSSSSQSNSSSSSSSSSTSTPQSSTSSSSSPTTTSQNSTPPSTQTNTPTSTQSSSTSSSTSQSSSSTQTSSAPTPTSTPSSSASTQTSTPASQNASSQNNSSSTSSPPSTPPSSSSSQSNSSSSSSSSSSTPQSSTSSSSSPPSSTSPSSIPTPTPISTQTSVSPSSSTPSPASSSTTPQTPSTSPPMLSQSQVLAQIKAGDLSSLQSEIAEIPQDMIPLVDAVNQLYQIYDIPEGTPLSVAVQRLLSDIRDAYYKISNHKQEGVNTQQLSQLLQIYNTLVSNGLAPQSQSASKLRKLVQTSGTIPALPAVLGQSYAGSVYNNSNGTTYSNFV